MELSKNEIMLEEKRLGDTIDIIRSKISELGQELYDRDDKVLEFKKFMWDNRSDMDPTELKTMMSSNDLEISMMMKKGEYLQKLFKIQNNLSLYGEELAKLTDSILVQTIGNKVTLFKQREKNSKIELPK